MADGGAAGRIAPGTVERVDYVVREADLASALPLRPGESFPPVLATTRAIALLELASARLLLPLLGPGQLSVGVVVDVKHTAATPAGAAVTAWAKYLGEEGGLHAFEVWLDDPKGEAMRGRHQRAVIDEARLMASARKRGGAAGP